MPAIFFPPPDKKLLQTASRLLNHSVHPPPLLSVGGGRGRGRFGWASNQIFKKRGGGGRGGRDRILIFREGFLGKRSVTFFMDGGAIFT